ncbi:hypothetical protein CMV_021338 [Castanea mollissima]|uniref:Uncharacterized protein n=1 Tax=Castanea mollissima TaxID=60419 RepID=A0A8J4QUH9_9ROSI|nr:hypothetical protein CMV_021338 [Castanea mollissima]
MEPFVVPGLPDMIEITRAQLPNAVNIDPTNTMDIREECREAELEAFGVIVNTFEELEPAYVREVRKSNKALSRSPKHTPFTSEKTEKTEEAHLRNPNTRLCFLPPPPQPDRRSLTAGAALRQKLTPSPDSFLSHRILLLLPLAGFSSCFLLPDSPLAHAFTGFSSCPNLLLPKSPDSFLELVNMPEPHKGCGRPKAAGKCLAKD